MVVDAYSRWINCSCLQFNFSGTPSYNRLYKGLGKVGWIINFWCCSDHSCSVMLSGWLLSSCGCSCEPLRPAPQINHHQLLLNDNPKLHGLRTSEHWVGERLREDFIMGHIHALHRTEMYENNFASRGSLELEGPVLWACLAYHFAAERLLLLDGFTSQ